MIMKIAQIPVGSMLNFSYIVYDEKNSIGPWKTPCLLREKQYYCKIHYKYTYAFWSYSGERSHFRDYKSQDNPAWKVYTKKRDISSRSWKY